MRKFLKAYIEITNVCDLSCSFCPKTRRVAKFMDSNDFEHVIDEVGKFTDRIYFHLMGEPLLNENIAEFMNMCKVRGLFVNLTTNGTLIAKRGAEILKTGALRKISFSLHSFEANCLNTDLEGYLSDIVDFCREASKAGTVCQLRLWNESDGEIIGQNDLNESIIQFVNNSLCGQDKVSGNRIVDNVFWGFGNKFEWRTETDNDIEFCYGLRDHFGVLADGTVVPCCMDNEGELRLGNIFEESLEGILESSKAMKLYNGFSGRKAVFDRCKKCGYARRFGGRENAVR